MLPLSALVPALWGAKRLCGGVLVSVLPRFPISLLWLMRRVCFVYSRRCLAGSDGGWGPAVRPRALGSVFLRHGAIRFAFLTRIIWGYGE